MTTINTIEDLIKLLDEKPEWLEAVRARILTRELLDLPQTLAEFIETTNRRFDEADKRFDAIEQTMGAMQGDIKAMRGDIKAMQGDIKATQEDVKSMQGDIKATQEDVKAMQGDIKATQEDVKAMQGDIKTTQEDVKAIRNDIGVLKGGHARTSAYREPSAITDGLGLNRIRNLGYNDLRNLTVSADTSGIPSNDILSFRRADMVLEATDQAGQICYVAVEISFTVNGRDTERAIRNASFLTRFTGCSAHAAVAGLYRDNRIDHRVDSGEVFWHQLNLDDLEAE